MDDRTARILNDLTNAFYDRAGASFSGTRRRGWPGWRRCLGAIAPALREGAHRRGAASLADLGCGNLRFEAFLADELPDLRIEVAALDACTDLASIHALDVDERIEARFRRLDAFEALSSPNGSEALPGRIREAAPSEGNDAAVAFGLLHHVPGAARRAALVRALASAVRPRGVVAVSLWRFLDDPRFAERADADHERLLEETGLAGIAPHLDEGDRLLGWQGERALARFCHSFSDADASALIASVSDFATIVDRFRSDGRTGASNEYLVFARRS